jgi:hypothetical protein
MTYLPLLPDCADDVCGGQYRISCSLPHDRREVRPILCRESLALYFSDWRQLSRIATNKNEWALAPEVLARTLRIYRLVLSSNPREMGITRPSVLAFGWPREPKAAIIVTNNPGAISMNLNTTLVTGTPVQM